MKFWLDMGIDGFRADAVPYLIEREGTNCENLPENPRDPEIDPRLIWTRIIRTRCFWLKPINGPRMCAPISGMAMNSIWASISRSCPESSWRSKKATPRLSAGSCPRPPIFPEGTQWCTFLRNHDELTLEMVTEDERQWMWAGICTPAADAPESRHSPPAGPADG